MSRSPDYRLKGLDRTTNKKGTLGAGWVNPDKSISIVLDTFVILSGRDNLMITLFPADVPYAAQQQANPIRPKDATDDECPF